MARKPKYEYRLVIRWPKGKRRTVYHQKRNLEHAEDDMKSFIEEQKTGKLSPYWDGAATHIDKREVKPWERVK